ncbi:hypothetical protein QJR26_17920 (plasmid) [Clostridium baratii]
MNVAVLEFVKEARIINRQIKLIGANKDEFSEENKADILKILDTLDKSITDVREELK